MMFLANMDPASQGAILSIFPQFSRKREIEAPLNIVEQDRIDTSNENSPNQLQELNQLNEPKVIYSKKGTSMIDILSSTDGVKHNHDKQDSNNFHIS
jgi:hypothetical protein